VPQTEASIRADFDRIALLREDGWNHNKHYHSYLLKHLHKHLPQGIGEALDIGSGTGEFARCLASSAKHVTGVDLSPEMARVARERSRQYPNIDYVVGDIMQMDLSPETYDCVASIATLHHMSLASALEKAKAALKSGGVLLALDLYRSSGNLADALTGAVATPWDVVLRISHGVGLRVPPEVRQAWHEHGRHDRYLTVEQVRRTCARIIPGAKVRRHLLWRYSVVWVKR
jgi:ubiquinone/menaquinone biosynthesis C-methylase UbiE